LSIATRSLERFPLVHTRSADEICDAVSRVYSKLTLEFERRANKGVVKFNYCRMADIGVGCTTYGIGLKLNFLDTDLVFQSFPLCGCGEAVIDHDVKPLRPGDGVTVSAGTSYKVTLAAGYRHFTLVMDPCALAKKLAALTGATIDCPLRFDPAQNVRNPRERSLRDHFFFLVNRLNAGTDTLPKFVLDEFEQTLMVIFLHAKRHNYSHLLEWNPPEAALGQVRRTEDYIEANAHRTITLDELAEVSGVSALSLFRSFRKYRGCSPMAFLSQVRARHRHPLS